MLIRLPNGTLEVIDFREVAPIKANKDTFNPSVAGLKVGVP